MKRGFFITLEGTEGSGKSTQIRWLAERLRREGRTVRELREPGGTPIGEEIRHTLKHSAANGAMTPETELLLMNACRAQLVREVIRPALAVGEVVICDRFLDSTVVYQGYGRQLDLEQVRRVIDISVGTTRPDLTLLLFVPIAISEARRRQRESELAAPPARDRMEEAGRDFFERVERGYRDLAAAEPERVRFLDATANIETVREAIWREVSEFMAREETPPANGRESRP